MSCCCCCCACADWARATGACLSRWRPSWSWPVLLALGAPFWQSSAVEEPELVALGAELEDIWAESGWVADDDALVAEIWLRKDTSEGRTCVVWRVLAVGGP